MSFFKLKRATQLSRKVVNETAWWAVYFDLGPRPAAPLVREAYFWAEYCYEAAASRAADPGKRAMGAFEPNAVECGRRASVREHADAALRRLTELEAIDPTLQRRCAH